MQSCQLECDIVVVKVVPQGVFAVMAGQAVTPECLHMGLHEIGFDLLVAGCTHGLIKIRKSITGLVAVLTTEGGTIGLHLVGND